MVGGRDELSLLLFDHGTLLPQSGLLLVWIPSLYALDPHSTKNIQEIKIWCDSGALFAFRNTDSNSGHELRG